MGDYFVIPGFPGFETGNVRVINASPEIGEVDVWNRLFPYWAGLSLGEISDYSPINDGQRTLRVVAAGAQTDENAIAEMILKFPEDTFHTVILAGPAGALNFIQIEEDSTGVESDRTEIRLIHAFNGVGDVALFDGNNMLTAAIGYPSQNDVVSTSNPNGLQIRLISDSSVLWSADQADLMLGRPYSLIVFPTGNDASPIGVFVLEETVVSGEATAS